MTIQQLKNLLKKRQALKKIVTGVFMCLAMVQFNSYAIEGALQLHQGDESDTKGFSIGISDQLFNQKGFNWSITYNRLDDVMVEWNNDTLDFSIDTIDLMLTYRFQPKSYNKTINNFSFEVQGGAGLALTENKFVWPNLNEERFFSEKNDVNAVVAFVMYYKLSKETSAHIGVKHYPDYSNFDDVSSVFLGFNYRFGRQVGY